MARKITPSSLTPKAVSHPKAENDNSETPNIGAERCPICKNPTVYAFRPFCSKRCADVDLGRWVSGRYAIPVGEDDDEDGMPGDDGQGAGADGLGRRPELGLVPRDDDD